MQVITTALLVLTCSLYMLGLLMPERWRAPMAHALLALPWPHFMAQRLRRWLIPATAGGCEGCGGKSCGSNRSTGPTSSLGTEQPIRVHRRPHG